MDRTAEYRQYLKSQDWYRLREFVKRRAGGRCELCYQPMAHVHHVRYPKKFKDDHPDNIISVCEICHDKIHGIRRIEKMSTEIMIVNLPFDSNMSFKFIENENGKWFFVDEIIEKVFKGHHEVFFGLTKMPINCGGPDPNWYWDFIDVYPGGQKVCRMLNKKGFAWFAAKGKSTFAKQLYNWLTTDVWNSITDTGKYDISSLKGNQPSDKEIRRAQFNMLGRLLDDVERLESKVDLLEKETSEKFIELEKKQNELYKAANKMTLIAYEGKTTVRARMQQLGVSYDKEIAGKVGWLCRKRMNVYGDYSSSKVYDKNDGNNVNVWPVEVIDDCFYELGLLRD